jgi:predicted MarR family transcription regulator
LPTFTNLAQNPETEVKSKRVSSSRTALRRAKLSATGHLSTTRQEARLTELEFGLEHLLQAYYRWKSLCFRAVCDVALSGEDVAVLNTIRMGDDPKQLSEIAGLLNRTDMANLQYALRKLAKAGLIDNTGSPSRRETRYRVTTAGRDVTDAYSRMRLEILMPLLDKPNAGSMDSAALGRAFSVLARHYEEAGHGALIGRRRGLAPADGESARGRGNRP